MSEKLEKASDNPHYYGHRQRLRERFIKSEGKGLADYELLEVMLFASKPRGDVKPLAKALLKEFGSLARVISADYEELSKINGMGDAAIVGVKTAQVCAARLLAAEVEEKPVLQSWKSLLDYCRATMSFNKTEQFRIFFLDRKNKLISDELQQEGTVDHTPVYPREVVKRALDLSASSIILVHNHPSGDPTPSKSDIMMTQKIVDAAKAVGINVHDHLIVGGKQHYSFASHGML